MSKGLEGWKIRNKEGLFSTGGSHPLFCEVGETWNTLRAVKQHMAARLNPWGSNCEDNKKIRFYKDCDIVCFELKEKEVLPVSAVYKGKL